MSFFTIQDIQLIGRRSLATRSAKSILREQSELFKPSQKYDIFLSHSFSDAELVLGVAKVLERAGLSVYVDWIEDPHLDRSNVTQKVAEYIRERMKSCGSLVYATSKNSTTSKWMPWELGFFDGYKPGKIHIFPLLEKSSDSFKGQEYLSLYPVLTKELLFKTGAAIPSGIKKYPRVIPTGNLKIWL